MQVGRFETVSSRLPVFGQAELVTLKLIEAFWALAR
jgi:hypothetical protein